MDTVVKCAGLAVAGSILALVVRKQSGEFAALSPVLKTLAIGFLTETGKNICEDAGEKTIGGVLQFCGSVASFYVMLPLLQSVLDLLERIL